MIEFIKKKDNDHDKTRRISIDPNMVMSVTESYYCPDKYTELALVGRCFHSVQGNYDEVLRKITDARDPKTQPII